jgi:hypothetical protein
MDDPLYQLVAELAATAIVVKHQSRRAGRTVEKSAIAAIVFIWLFHLSEYANENNCCHERPDHNRIKRTMAFRKLQRLTSRLCSFVGRILYRSSDVPSSLD